jgi:phenylpropionate dioxygenase-like ring-hydroxylating dioxygenase large terminal subunit
MIKNQWYAVASSRDIKPGRLYYLKRLSMELVFFRNSRGDIRCVSDKCPHRGASVGRGCMVMEDGSPLHGSKLGGVRLRCPFHGIEFDEYGKCVCVPAEGRASEKNYSRFDLEEYSVREIGDIVFLWYGDGKPASEPPAFPVMTDERFVYSHVEDLWHTHYSRCIENQLDVQHLAFVHHNTIGRGNKTISNGPKVVWLDENTLQTSANNEVDKGQISKNAAECIINPTNLTFKYPNIWLNTINDKIYILAFFVPVDENHCILAVRFYNRITGFRPLDRFIAWTGKWANLIIERQDKRVVEYQRPKKTARRIDERLLMADKPIIEYRRRREELQTIANEL